MSYSMLLAGKLLILAVIPPWLLMFGLWYRSYLKVQFGRGLMIAAVASAIGVAWAYGVAGAVTVRSPRLAPFSIRGLCFMLMVMFSCGLFVRIYAVWIMDSATEQERLPNAKGVRAWLGFRDLLTVAGIMGGAYVGMGWSVWGTLAGVLALLLAYPLMNVALQGGEAAQVNAEEDLAQERRRVLALVEAGKITGADGAELIAALGQSRVATKPSGGLSGARRFMLMGALLVLVGFCLPWFTIDLGTEMQSAVDGMTPAMGQNMPAIPRSLPQGSVRVPTFKQNWLMFRGGDISKGLGWIILAMGLGAAVLPLLWPTRPANRQSQRGVSLAGLGVGTVLLIYLTGMGIPQMDVGIYLAMAGYAVLWIGALREYVGWGQRAGIAVAA